MPLSRQELESKLWQAADILRGQIDSADYKNYIFSTSSLKRLSDRFSEEVETAVASGVPRDVALKDRDEHEFFVPDSAGWETITVASMNLGETLNIASHAVEEANTPRLDGVLAHTNWKTSRSSAAQLTVRASYAACSTTSATWTCATRTCGRIRQAAATFSATPTSI